MTTLSAAQREVAEKALEDLEQQRSGAWYQSASTLAADDSARAAALYFLKVTAPDAIDSLRRQLDRSDAAERWGVWVEQARALQGNIASVANSTTEWGFTSMLYGVATQTASDVSTGAGQIAAAAKSGTTWGALAFLVLGFVAWKVLK